MVNNIVKAFETDSTFSNISVEKSNTNDNVGQLAQLSDFLWSTKRNEWSQTCSWQDGLKGSSNFSFDGARGSWGKLD
jgi:hypothetical protein